MRKCCLIFNRCSSVLIIYDAVQLVKSAGVFKAKSGTLGVSLAGGDTWGLGIFVGSCLNLFWRKREMEFQ